MQIDQLGQTSADVLVGMPEQGPGLQEHLAEQGAGDDLLLATTAGLGLSDHRTAHVGHPQQVQQLGVHHHFRLVVDAGGNDFVGRGQAVGQRLEQAGRQRGRLLHVGVQHVVADEVELAIGARGGVVHPLGPFAHMGRHAEALPGPQRLHHHPLFLTDHVDVDNALLDHVHVVGGHVLGVQHIARVHALLGEHRVGTEGHGRGRDMGGQGLVHGDSLRLISVYFDFNYIPVRV